MMIKRNPMANRSRARGSAMSEMVLVLPVMLLVFVLLLLLGRGMVRVQRAQVLDRYAVWREVAQGGGPGVPLAGPDEGVNQIFFNRHAANIRYDPVAAPAATREAGTLLVNDAAAYSSDTGLFAARIIADLDRGVQWRFEVTYDETMRLLEPFNFTIRRMHHRISHDWPYVVQRVLVSGQPIAGSYVYTGILTIMREIFLSDFIQAAQSAIDNAQADQLLQRILDLPNQREGYVGPTVAP